MMKTMIIILRFSYQIFIALSRLSFCTYYHIHSFIPGSFPGPPLNFSPNFFPEKNDKSHKQTTHLTKQPIIMHRSLYVTNKTKLIFDLSRFRLIQHILTTRGLNLCIPRYCKTLSSIIECRGVLGPPRRLAPS